MSLLDRPRDAVSLRPEVDAVDEYGTPTRVPGPPVMVGGRMQPIQFGEDGDATSNMTVYKFITRSLPPGAWFGSGIQAQVSKAALELRHRWPE